MPAMPVRAALAKTAPAVDEATAVGTMRADEAVTIRPEIPGRIAEFRFKEGQRVERGALLVRLDQAELAAVLASSRAQAGLDRQRVERAEDLFRKNFISQQAFDEARANAARSAAKQREDEARLAKTEISAPFAGVVGLRQVSEGAFVAAGTDIARLEKIDQLKLDFRVPEVYVGRLQPGQAVRVQLDAYGDLRFPGAVYAIEPAVDEATRTVLARARVANPQLKLRPGMFARVLAQLAVRENAVWIPEQAIVPRGQDSFVFRVVDGKAEMVKVQTGVRKVGEVEISQGVTAGDLVVTEGLQRIGPGSAVTVMQGAPKPAAAAADKKG
ncbi:MAG: efflux RND transporter periplasmic adaptor subunit [Betaproteobacteria bacterium]|nr:efflux RND transporter periplasmic adaptor subunit [Betaproteobacteria bacterium]